MAGKVGVAWGTHGIAWGARAALRSARLCAAFPKTAAVPSSSPLHSASLLRLRCWQNGSRRDKGTVFEVVS